MRTTGLRKAPPKVVKKLDYDTPPPTATDTNSVLDQLKNVTIEEHPNVTLNVISKEIPPREGLAHELARVADRSPTYSESNFVSSPVTTPPPKPPRTFSHIPTPPEERLGEKEEEESPISHPGPPITPTALYLLKRLSRKSSIDETEPLSPALISNPTTPQQYPISPFNTLPHTQVRANSTKTLIGESRMAWRSLRRRILSEDVPPPSQTSSPPAIPSTSSSNQLYPSLSSVADSASATGTSTVPQPIAVRPRNTQSSQLSNGNAEILSPSTRTESTRPRQPQTRPAPNVRPAAAAAAAAGISGSNVESSAGLAGGSFQDPAGKRALLDQGPITEPSEFEGACKKIFQLQRNSRSLMEQGQYNKVSSSDGSEIPPSPGSDDVPGPSSQTTSSFRELLKIREGVKIFFIHDDGIVTSPWNRPFLSIAKDPSKSLHEQSLLLRVGKSLWFCELVSKLTPVFKSDGSTYVFKETNNKPECVAVAIRVPSSVRKVQHELLLRIMQQHTRLEEERPSGITKSVSKGAASAATRVNKIVENGGSDTNQAFVRRNSIRALKGMSKRLNSLAQKTGSTLPELPEEYVPLQEAANTLRFSRSARTVQFI